MDTETRFLLEDLCEHAQAAQEFLGDLSVESFRADRRTVFAVARAIEVVGEAANCVDRAFQASHTEVPWSDIIGMRHKLAHGYRAVLDIVLYETVPTCLPPLVSQLQRLLQRAADSTSNGPPGNEAL